MLSLRLKGGTYMRSFAVAAVLAASMPFSAEAAVLLTTNEAFFISDTGAALLPVDPLVGPDETRALNGTTAIGPARFTAADNVLSAVGENVVTRYGDDFLRLTGRFTSLTVDLARGTTAFGFRIGGLNTVATTQICADEFCIFTFPPAQGSRFFGFKDVSGLQTLRITTGSEFVDLSALRSNGAVPEPSAWAMLIAGFGLAGAALRRRRALGPALA
jgi:hypothetical protein